MYIYTNTFIYIYIPAALFSQTVPAQWHNARARTHLHQKCARLERQEKIGARVTYPNAPEPNVPARTHSANNVLTQNASRFFSTIVI